MLPLSKEAQELREGVRKRPGMYIGDARDGAGLHRLIWEVVGHAVDQHLQGHASRLEVRLDGRRICVVDDGDGIPVREDSTGRPIAERYLTEMHLKGPADGEYSHVHIGQQLQEMGIALVNFLSEEFVVRVQRDGREYGVKYHRGETTDGLQDLGIAQARGTRIEFVPDREIFGEVPFDGEQVGSQLQELAYLNPGLALSWQNTRLWGGDGLGTMCEVKTGSSALDRPVLRIRGFTRGVSVDAALCWTKRRIADVTSYVSQRRTEEGGTHVQGFWQGLRQALTLLEGESVKGLKTRDFRNALSDGLVAIIHAGLYAPSFDGPKRAWLVTPEARTAVSRVIRGGTAVYLKQYPELAAQIRDRLRSPDGRF